MKIAKLLSLFAYFSNLSSTQEKLPKSTDEIKLDAYLNLWMLFALSLFIVEVLIKGFPKQSSTEDKEDCDCHSILFILEELYPLSYEEVDDHVLLHETNYSLTNIVNEDDDDQQEFVPRLVHLKLIEGASTECHEFGDKDLYYSNCVEVKPVAEGAYIRSDNEENNEEEFHGYDGYDEDNDDEGDEDDVDSSIADNINDNDDLRTRIEEFIAMNVRKWKEEILIDNLLYLDY